MSLFSSFPIRPLGALAVVALAAGCGSPTYLAPDLDHLEIVSGNDQQGPAGLTLPDSVVVVTVAADGGTSPRGIWARIPTGDGGVAVPGRASYGPGALVDSDSFTRMSVAWTLGTDVGPQSLDVFALRNNGDTVSVVVHATAVAAH